MGLLAYFAAETKLYLINIASDRQISSFVIKTSEILKHELTETENLPFSTWRTTFSAQLYYEICTWCEVISSVTVMKII